MTGMPLAFRNVFVFGLAALISACGGGGGGGGTTPPTGNQPPVAAIAGPEAVEEGAAVSLDASASTDPDGEISTFAWRRVSGPSIDLSGENGAAVTFDAPSVEKDADLVVEVTVTDDDGASDTARITVRIHNVVPGNANPVADAGPDVSVSPGAGVTLDGTASADSDGQIVAYGWEQLEGTPVELAGADTASATFTAPATDEEIALVFRLTVTDDRGATASDTVVVTVVPETGGNRPPVIGGIDGVPAAPVPEGGSVTLTINASDPDEDALAFSWQLIEPSDGSLVFDGVTFPVEAAQLTLPLPDVSTDTAVRLRAEVSDGNLQNSVDVEFVIAFENRLPTVSLVTEPADLADAGILEGQPFTITANAADPDGKPGLTYTWAQTAGSVDFSGELANTTGPELALTAPDVSADETYGFQVTVRDADGGEAASAVEFPVIFVNQPPVANAGADIGGVAERTSVQLDGSASFDPEGGSLSYAWRQISGPAVAAIDSTSIARPTIELPDIASGSAVIEFELVVTDPLGVTSAPDVVSIAFDHVNQAPVASIVPLSGPVDEGNIPFFLDGSESTDPDGETGLDYLWIVPPGFSVVDATAALLQVTGTPDVVADTDYTFTLRVTDPEGASDTADTTVTVRFVNQAPELSDSDITGARTVTEGAAVQLTAQGRDADIDGGGNQTLTYSWSLVDNPANLAVPDEVPGLIVEAAELAFTAPEIGSTPVTVTYDVRAHDGLADSTPPVSVTITFEPDTTAPEIIAPADLEVDEGNGDPVSFTLSPTVTDNKTATADLTYNWFVPSGFDVDAATTDQRELLITGTPDVGPDGGSGTFGLTVTDADGNQATANFDVTVRFVNRAPTVTANNVDVPENTDLTANPVTITATASDPDIISGDEQQLTYSWRIEPAGSGLLFEGGVEQIDNTSADTVRLVQLPDVSADEVFDVFVSAHDGLTASPAHTATVTVRFVNQQPVITGVDGPANDEIAEDANGVVLTVNYEDPDDGQGHSIEWEVPQAFVPFINGGTSTSTLLLNGVPDVTEDTPYLFRVAVTDSSGDPDTARSATFDYTLTVRFVNQAPVIESVSGTTGVNEGTGPHTLTASASDADNDALTYTWSISPNDTSGLDPAALQMSANGDTLTFSAPDVTANTTVVFRVIANDGERDSAPVDHTVTIFVDGTAPVIESVEHSAASVLEGSGRNYTITVTASDNQTAAADLQFAWTVPAGFTVSGETGNVLTITATPNVGPGGGEFPFQVQVTDADGNSIGQTIDVRVDFDNVDPVITGISAAQTAFTEGGSKTGLTFEALASDADEADGQVLSYTWVLPQGFEASGVNNRTMSISRTPDVTADTPFDLRVDVSDGVQTVSETITVNVLFVNQQPTVAIVNPPASVPEGTQVTLTADAVDPDGNGIAGFSWTQTAGPEVSMDTGTPGQLTFTAPSVGPDDNISVAFEVVATDVDHATEGGGQSAPATASIAVAFVNQAPVVGDIVITDNASGASTTAVDEGNVNLTFSISATDPDEADGQTLAYAWTVPQGFDIVGGAASSTLTVTATPNVIADTPFDFSVEVSDGLATPVTKSATLGVNFVNQQPEADAGAPLAVSEDTTLDGSIVLDGSGSQDQDIVDGATQTLSYTWSVPAASGLQFAGGADDGSGNHVATTASETIAITALPDVAEDTEITVTLTVDDGAGAANSRSAAATTTVTVLFENVAPVADAGADLAIDEDADLASGAFMLDGSGSRDDDGQTLTYLWQVPAGSGITLDDPAKAQPVITGLPDVITDTVYEITLTVDDGSGLANGTATDTVNLTVRFVNQAPVAEAGANLVIPEDLNGGPFQLDGSASFDNDGQALTFSWDVGRSGIVLEDPASPTPIVTSVPDVIEDTVFTLTLTVDDGISTDTDTVDVTVGFVNQTPQITDGSASPNPVDEGNGVALTVSAIDPDDPDGTRQDLVYEFTQVSGPTVTINHSTPTSNGATFTAPDVGPAGATLGFQVVAVDPDDATHGNGRSAPFALSVTVNFVNEAPVIDSISATPGSVTPGNSVTLDADASDVDGQSLTYTWTQLDNGAPAVVTLTPVDGDPGAVTFVAPDVQSLDGHTLQFQVIVDDGSGTANATASDTVNVNLVFENTAPVINGVAASPDSVDEGATFTLVADVTDPDQALGQTLSYTWRQRQGETPSVGTITTNPDGSATIVAPSVLENEVIHFVVRVRDGVTSVTSNEVPVTINDLENRVVQFNFEDMPNAAPDILHTSNEIVIAGLADGLQVPISISGGEYSKNGGPFLSDGAGDSVINGDTIRVRGRSSANGGEVTQVTLTVGDEFPVTDNFDITTSESVLEMNAGVHRQLSVSWGSMGGVSRYELYRSIGLGDMELVDGQIDPGATQYVVDDDVGPLTGQTLEDMVFLLKPCNENECSEVPALRLETSALELSAKLTGYLKRRFSGGVQEEFGQSVSVSADGNTLAVGAPGARLNRGEVFILVRDGAGRWVHQAAFLASNAEEYDKFGTAVSLSADGNTLVVGAPWEGSAATGVNGDQQSNAASRSGAAYVFTRDAEGNWTQEAYLKASNTDPDDEFGSKVVISADGNWIAVSSIREQSNAVGVNGDQQDNSLLRAGAVYVFSRSNGTWSQHAYVKASNTGYRDSFGADIAISSDGSALAVGASGESSNATGINGSQDNDLRKSSGAVYVFVRDEFDQWVQEAYVKASNPDAGDYFGSGVALSDDGQTLVVSATYESSGATGVNGDQFDNSVSDSGAVYVFSKNAGMWSQQAYIKAPVTDAFDRIGGELALSRDGTTLAIGTVFEDGSGTGIDGDFFDNAATTSGAVFLYRLNQDGDWEYQNYVKASNTDPEDYFASAVALDGTGQLLVVGASREDSRAGGVGGDQSDNGANGAGAVYVY